MLFNRELFAKLSQQLYPTGRALRFFADSELEKLHLALGEPEADFVNASIELFDHIIPDNANFTAEDATSWERRLGLITNDTTLLADRIAAIVRKMNFPGTQLARQNYRWLEYQLHLAGFDVIVYENRFSDGMGGYTTKTPLEVDPLGDFVDDFEYGEIEFGEAEYGGYYNNIVLNNIDKELERVYSITNLRNTCFIGGATLGTYANVPASREKEFRELIIKTKPLQVTGFLFVNYTV